MEIFLLHISLTPPLSTGHGDSFLLPVRTSSAALGGGGGGSQAASFTNPAEHIHGMKPGPT